MAKSATLCFVKYKEKILMINRNKPPFMGLWNAVGGHVEEGESPLDCAKREVFEESGIRVDSLTLLSVFTWNYDDETGYAFYTELPDGFDVSGYPLSITEGVVDFKDIPWILDDKNYGVIEDIRVFINDIKNGVKQNYHLVYKDKKLIDCIVKD